MGERCINRRCVSFDPELGDCEYGEDSRNQCECRNEKSDPSDSVRQPGEVPWPEAPSTDSEE